MKFYIYFLLIIFLIIFVFENLRKNNKFSPFKIKILCNIVLTFMLIREITLLVMFVASNIANLYLFKVTYFLNIVYIPIIALIIIYILFRSNKIKVIYIFFTGAFLLGIYLYFMCTLGTYIKIDISCGYFMKLFKGEKIYILHIIFALFCIGAALIMYSKSIYKIGIILIITTCIVFIIETLFYVIGKGIFVNIIISDVFWSISLNYALSKLKKARQ